MEFHHLDVFILHEANSIKWNTLKKLYPSLITLLLQT